MGNRSITLKFLLWTWGVLLLVTSALFVFATGRAERVVVAEAEERARQAMDLVRFLLVRQAPFSGQDRLAAWVDDLGRHLGFRLTYIVNGRVVADSEVGTAGVGDMESHADRPEVRQAEASGQGQDERISRTLGRDMLYVAARFEGAPGAPAGILRLALPYSALKGELGRFRETLLAVLALVFAAGGLAAWGLARSMSRSLREISGVLAAVGEGRFERRIHIVPAREFRPLAEAVNTLAARIGEHVREIEEQRDRHQAVLDGMAEGLAILDANGRIKAVNRSLAALFPQTPELVGRSPIEAGMSLEIERMLGAMLREGSPSRRAGRFPLPGGRVVEVSAVPVSDAAGRRQLIATFHDITEVACLESIFRDFVINASHRLRTPLTKVLGFAETARDLVDTDPGRARQALNVVVRGAGEMQGVIDDLLAVAQTRYAAVKAGLAPVDVGQALRQALDAAGPGLRARGVSVGLEAIPDEPLPVRTDPDGLMRVLAALLAQIPDHAAAAVTVATAGETVEIRFEGPATPLPDARAEALAGCGGEVVFEGATRLLRLALVRPGPASLGQNS